MKALENEIRRFLTDRGAIRVGFDIHLCGQEFICPVLSRVRGIHRHIQGRQMVYL